MATPVKEDANRAPIQTLANSHSSKRSVITRVSLLIACSPDKAVNEGLALNRSFSFTQPLDKLSGSKVVSHFRGCQGEFVRDIDDVDG
jgi:hypothetical protein